MYEKLLRKELNVAYTILDNLIAAPDTDIKTLETARLRIKDLEKRLQKANIKLAKSKSSAQRIPTTLADIGIYK